VVTENLWGEIKDTSVLEPHPEQVGLISVVSRSEQFSPLKPQAPVWR
jgi:hypothetical protein